MDDSRPPAGPGAVRIRAEKQRLRATHREARNQIGADSRRAADDARDARILALVPPGTTVASYLSLPVTSRSHEPGTLRLVESLRQRGHEVLVPVLTGQCAPDWTAYEGPQHLRPGLWGIPEVDAEPLGEAALTRADVVLCSGMAGTVDGRRLGVGGGWYDRALNWARPDALLVLLLTEADVVDDLPVEPHDRRVHVIVTESRTIDCRADSGL